MTLYERIVVSRAMTIVITILAVLFALSLISIGVYFGRNVYLNMTLSTICPDFFSYEYAYVVDEEGNGMDSVAVMLRDNSDINMIYRTFTDSSGRFVLFHDFGSFALYNMPFAYYLFVSTDDGWNDTIRYRFKRHRVCHFKKIEGPDTIVCRPGRRSTMKLQLEEIEHVMIDSGFGFAPWNKVVLTPRIPSEVTTKLPLDNVLYTTITIAASPIPFAVIPVREHRVIFSSDRSLSEGVWYLFDHDGDGDCTDEKPVHVSSKGQTAGSELFDCTMRACQTIDSVKIRNHWYRFELRLNGMRDGDPVLQVRRADAITGTLTITSNRLLPTPPRTVNTEELFDAFEPPAPIETLCYRVMLWDRALLDFSDRHRVVMVIDRNHDGTFDTREGSTELFEKITGRITFNQFSFMVDTISSDGRQLFCSDLRAGSNQPANAMKGAWSHDFSVAASYPLSLYQECSTNRYVLLYFFEGSTKRSMEDEELRTLISLMREQIGPTRLIGVNRQATDDSYCKEPVVLENRGWQGALVRQFHNHRMEEIFCLDSTATIVYRGGLDTSAITAIWEHARCDSSKALLLFNQCYADRMMDAPRKHPGERTGTP